ncbi:MAG TPA: DUF1697 domain-containing protein [Nocardioidaceae bacterium]|nr:DUF1697 domain-containing protein [Nocardioidaceae bacterium]
MSSYIAFLRALNVGNRQYKMADLRACLGDAGLTDVETYIQTGNVRFTTTMRSAPKVEAYVEKALQAGCGFDVPSIILTPEQLRQVYEDATTTPPPHDGVQGERRYVSVFKDGEQPTGEAAERIAAWDAPGEAGLVIGRAVHVWLDGPMSEAKFFGEFKKPLAPGTNRNLTVIRTLAEKWT